MSWSKVIIQAEEQARLQSEGIEKALKSSFVRTNRTLQLIIDLTVAHNEFPLGLESGIVYRWLTVEAMAAPFAYRLKSLDNSLSDPFTGLIGASISQHDFKEILVTNAVGVGQAIMQVGWKE